MGVEVVCGFFEKLFNRITDGHWETDHEQLLRWRREAAEHARQLEARAQRERALRHAQAELQGWGYFNPPYYYAPTEQVRYVMSIDGTIRRLDEVEINKASKIDRSLPGWW